MLDEAACAASCGHEVSVSAHLFAVTDAVLAERLSAVADHHKARVRLLLDWCQGGPGSGRQGTQLAVHPRISVRFQLDWPYVFEDGRLQWRYRESLGLCHHKMLAIQIDGVLTSLAFGSYNWTGRAANGYENVIVLRPIGAANAVTIWRHFEEFRAAWNTVGASISAVEAAELYDRGRHLGLEHDEVKQQILSNTLPCTGPESSIECTEIPEDAGSVGAPLLTIAFSGGPASERAPRRGFAPTNRNRVFPLSNLSGVKKLVPLTLEVLAQEVFNRSRQGDILRIAMFAFSRRGPEYLSMLEAARRGVVIRLLIDSRASENLRARLEPLITDEALPIVLRVTNRFMHQKYMVLEREALVMTGTANFTADSSRRHVESRLLIDGERSFVAQFIFNFDTIWNRTARRMIGNY